MNAVASDQSGCREDDLQTRVLRPHLEVDLRRERDDEHERTADQRAEPWMLPPATALDRIDRAQSEVQQHVDRDCQQRQQIRHRRVAVASQERTEVTLQAEDQHEDESRDDRRNRKRQVDQRRQKRATGEAELRDCPGRSDAEHEIERERGRRHDHRQLDRGERVVIVEQIVPIHADAFAQGLSKYVHERYHDQHADDEHGRGRQCPAHPNGVVLRPSGQASFSAHSGCSSAPPR